MSLQFALNPSFMGLYALSAFRVVLWIIVILPEVTGATDLYGFQLHNHPHLRFKPSHVVVSWTGHPFLGYWMYRPDWPVTPSRARGKSR